MSRGVCRQCGKCEPAVLPDGTFCRTTGVELYGPALVCTKFDHVGPERRRKGKPGGKRAGSLKRAETVRLGLPKWISAVNRLYPTLDPGNTGVAEQWAQAFRRWSATLNVHKMTYPCLTMWPLLFTATVGDKLGAGAAGASPTDVLLPRIRFFADHRITETEYKSVFKVPCRAMSTAWKQIKFAAMDGQGLVINPFPSPPAVGS